MLKLLHVLTATAAVAIFAGTTLAMPPGPPPGGPGFEPSLPLEGVTLTTAQQASIDNIQDSYHSALRTAERNLAAAHDTLFEQVISGTGEESAIRTAASKAGTKMADLAVVQSQMTTAIRAVLTDEQRAQVDANIAQMKQHRPNGRQ